jgi:sarcosine oxidase
MKVDGGAHVEVAVVGRGLIGSAAARHLAESGVAVALLGPGEPSDPSIHEGPFASHHDQARVTRIAAGQVLWARMAAAAIDRYEDISERSGIRFHRPRGLVSVPRDPDSWLANSVANGGAARLVDSDWVADRTGITVAADLVCIHEPAPAGIIDPLALVAAQTRLVEMADGLVVDEWVASLDRSGDRWRLTGPFGVMSADRVLLATGGFGSALCPAPLELVRRPRTVVMAEIPPLSDDRLPALIHDRIVDPDLEGIYWTPPVRYPDGRSYLKIGGDLCPRPEAEEAELTDWFRGGGDAREVAALTRVLGQLLPGVEIAATWSKPCVVVVTPTGDPYIGWVADGLAVALGGNGAAAKSSDEIGRLAATLFGPGWDAGYDPDAFTPRVTL